jgi:hypothetical protein
MRGSCCEGKMPNTAENTDLRVARLHRSASADRGWERVQIEERKLLRKVSTPAGAVAALLIRRLRAMMVRATGGMRGVRRHARRCVRRAHAMHRAWRYSEEEPAVGHQPESNQGSQDAASDRAVHYGERYDWESGASRHRAAPGAFEVPTRTVSKFAAGSVRRVAVSGQQGILKSQLTQQVLLIY